MPRRLTALVAGVAVLAACAGNGTPEATGRPDDSKPFVLFLGDSVMEEASDSLLYAVEASGDAHAAFALGANLPHDDSETAAWRTAVERYDPDLVVLLVGHWERLQVLGDFAAGRLLESGDYQAEIVDPALDLLTDQGARVLWVGPIALEDREESDFLTALEADFRAAADDRDDVDFVDGDQWVAPDGFERTRSGADGRPVQIRRADGAHLCPEGQLLLAAGLLDRFGPDLGITPPAGWQDDWRTQLPLEPGGCAESYHH
jgi:hypothetical protein